MSNFNFDFAAFVILLLALNVQAQMVMLLLAGGATADGVTDSPVQTAPGIATGVMKPWVALIAVGLLNILGFIPALYFGPEVAHTVGDGLLARNVTLDQISAALTSVVMWAIVAVNWRLAVSKSQSIFAAFAGLAFFADSQFSQGAWLSVGWGILVSIGAGGIGAYVLGLCVRKFKLDTRWSQTVWVILVWVALATVSIGHDFNDSLKFVGIGARAIQLGTGSAQFVVQPELIVICAVIVGLTTMLGLCRPILNRITKDALKGTYAPWQGAVAGFVAGICIMLAAILGWPMSTNHTVVAALVGASCAVSFHEADWKHVRIVAWGWLWTLGFNFFMSGLLSIVDTRAHLVVMVFSVAFHFAGKRLKKLRKSENEPKAAPD